VDRLQLFRASYKVGPKAGSLSYTMNPNDLKDVIANIRIGKQLSDFMVVAIHCHQNSFAFQAYSHDHNVPDFLVELAHLAIDNGADAFVGHGVHSLRGVEVYKGKPIFYGVSNFVYHEDAAAHITDPSRQPAGGGAGAQTHQPDSMVALIGTGRWEAGKLAEVRLHPVDLGQDRKRPNSRIGVPMTPSPELARRILEDVQSYSKPFGTTIAIENGVGVIRVAAGATSSQQ
jgi:poly-gamma-glutamate capsule biosynthesis protein CapA/YwtB (metallophosphatase superfamily)